MGEETEHRVARNEILFRDTNEAIQRGKWPGEAEKAVRFRCECGRLECSSAVGATQAEYEAVRRHPRRFLLLPGHELPEIETVVRRAETFVVVEKRNAAGELAAASDPRR